MSIKVRMPNGKVLAAKMGNTDGRGFRSAYVRVNTKAGEQVSVAGRVTTRHGYDRTLPFEVKMDGVNAIEAFAGANGHYAR